jgi:hypothetical protein
MMRRVVSIGLVGLVLLALILSGCEGYSQTGVRTTEHQGSTGGSLAVRANKASGSITQDIEVEGGSGLTLETDVTLTVGKGTFKIELLGENEQVTLSLEARDGQTVSGHGQMVVSGFEEEASYRVTAIEAEDVEYSMEYTFR